MIYVCAVLLGLAVSVGGSYIATVLAMFVNGATITDGPRLVLVTCPQCMFIGLLMSYVPFRRPALHAVWVAYLVILLAVSVGGVCLLAARVGLEQVNVTGYLKWSWIYALAFLPLSYPLAWLLLSGIKLMKIGARHAGASDAQT